MHVVDQYHRASDSFNLEAKFYERKPVAQAVFWLDLIITAVICQRAWLIYQSITGISTDGLLVSNETILLGNHNPGL